MYDPYRFAMVMAILTWLLGCYLVATLLVGVIHQVNWLYSHVNITVH